ncbi:MAG TPA: endonuclease/exonuclease/phosphatase family protein [Myxococcales bacterium]|jgi:endonuclease/exonuclease/phosphatase family metal-dependent hydrolase
MPELRLTTWNVLHRVHAVNWGEDAVEAFPDEAVRIARIGEAVRRWLASGTSVVCLQEVSGDQLACLRACVGPGVAVLEHCYPRVPERRRPGPALLADSTEHLVALSAVPDARAIESQTFPSDPGKGFLAVAVGGARVIGTHVSFGSHRQQQLAALAAAARAGSGQAVLLGDFNAEADVVRAGLGEGFALADLADQPCTRVATRSSEAHTIDHVAVHRGQIVSARVLDGEGLSDHNPVHAVVAFG